MDIQFYLKRPDAKAHTSIFARITYEAGTCKFYTTESINPVYWNPDTHQAAQTRKFPEYPEFNARLENIRQIIKTTYRKYLNDNESQIPTPGILKDLLDIIFGKKADATIREFFEYYKDFNKRSKQGERLSPKTKKATKVSTNKGFITTLNHLEAFQKTYKRRINFDSIDIQFHSDYINYLTNTAKLGLNAIGDHIKRIKTVLGEAKIRGVKVNPAYESPYFFKPQEQSDSIYLNSSELQKMEALDLSENPKLDRVRDLFLIGCYTGLRYSDYSILNAANIQDGFFEVEQSKTEKTITIPIHLVVKRIFDKYNSQLPQFISNQKSNEYLKEIGEKLPELKVPVTITYTKGGEKITETHAKWVLLTTHTARRSFATNEYLAGTPSITIMAVTGHTTESSFLKYIKLTPNEHAKILKGLWEKRNMLKAV
ncbi:site-specific integrase [Chitinophaga arvensicola]|uniref:Phage integrase family protein n=1 Tax=Chitinophaga arvensicola TaxID=29529 RepID=A0A1I0QJ92_9BACT|nr:site-specific integrase [Chitinophaga arvensicola]SEW27049.1 Phage integrase family protein [Chitinophaga arvensicola]